MKDTSKSKRGSKSKTVQRVKQGDLIACRNDIDEFDKFSAIDSIDLDDRMRRSATDLAFVAKALSRDLFAGQAVHIAANKVLRQRAWSNSDEEVRLAAELLSGDYILADDARGICRGVVLGELKDIIRREKTLRRVDPSPWEDLTATGKKPSSASSSASSRPGRVKASGKRASAKRPASAKAPAPPDTASSPLPNPPGPAPTQRPSKGRRESKSSP